MEDKKPLIRTAQITDPEATAAALNALLYGGDEPRRDTKAQGWSKLHYGEGKDSQKMWYEELTTIDKAISENVEVDPTALPTGGLVEKLDAATEKLSTWYAAAVPFYHKRLLHIHYDELAEISGDLRGGKINAAEAQSRFDNIMADVSEIVDFSKFMGG